MKGLTKRQSEVLQFVEQFISNHHYSPSYREIMARFGFSSVGSVFKHIQALKKKGFISNEKQCSRSLALSEESAPAKGGSSVEVPFMGQFAEGAPIETFSNIDMVTVPDRLVTEPDSTYILRAKGDSLLAEFITDGDLLLVEARSYAESGETVIATLGYQETYLRRYVAEDGNVRLLSATPAVDPIVVSAEEISVQGVVVGLLRGY